MKLIDNSIFSICRTASGDIYLGTMFGLLKYDKSTDGFRQIQELQGCFVRVVVFRTLSRKAQHQQRTDHPHTFHHHSFHTDTVFENFL